MSRDVEDSQELDWVIENAYPSSRHNQYFDCDKPGLCVDTSKSQYNDEESFHSMQEENT